MDTVTAPDSTLRNQRLACEPSRLVLVLAAAVLAVAAWIYLEVSGSAGPGVVLFVGAFAALAAVAPGLTMTDAKRHPSRPSPTRTPLGERLEALAAPGPLIWLLPFPVLAVMLLTLPLAYHHSPGNNSIIGLAFACALLGGSAGTVLGSRAWTFTLLVIERVIGEGQDKAVSQTRAVRTSYALGALAVVLAVIGSLFA